MNGRVSVVDKRDGQLADVDPEVFAPDERTRILQGLLMEVAEAITHCPRASTFSRLWDPEQINAAREADLNRYWVQRFLESLDVKSELSETS